MFTMSKKNSNLPSTTPRNIFFNQNCIQIFIVGQTENFICKWSKYGPIPNLFISFFLLSKNAFILKEDQCSITTQRIQKKYGFYPEVTKLLTQNLYESRILVFSSNKLSLFTAPNLATLTLVLQNSYLSNAYFRVAYVNFSMLK